MIYKIEARNNELNKIIQSQYDKMNHKDNTMNRNNEMQERSKSDSNSTSSNNVNDSLTNAIKKKGLGLYTCIKKKRLTKK